MNKVALIFTGGTIAMKVPSKQQGAVLGLSPREIVDTLHALTEFDHLVPHSFADLPSPSMTPKHMVDLKRVLDSYLECSDFSGAVIVHGTDTLEETAFFLDVTSTSPKPVVLTGAMKNASEIGYDGMTNLISSIRVVMEPHSVGKGVLIVMNYAVNAACEVMKTHTLNLDTFKSLDFGPLGIIDDEDVIYFRSQTQRKDYRLKAEISQKVYLIKCYAGLDGRIIDFLVQDGAEGLVLEALGRGNVPPDMMPAIRRACDQGLPVVIVSRSPGGRVLDTYGYPGGGKDLVRTGCLLGGSLSGPKARILLMLALGNQLDREAIRELY